MFKVSPSRFKMFKDVSRCSYRFSFHRYSLGIVSLHLRERRKPVIDGLFSDGSPFGWTSEHCTDEIQVDWGSYAWKCKGKEIIELKNHSLVSDDYK